MICCLVQGTLAVCPSLMAGTMTMQDVVDELEAKLSKKGGGASGSDNKELLARNALLEKQIKTLEAEVRGAKGLVADSELVLLDNPFLYTGG